MGSSGMKRRKRQHLPKVGTPQERRYAQREEQKAVVGNFGLNADRPWIFWTAIIVIVMVAFGAVAALIALD